jgi:hypothetical protein
MIEVVEYRLDRYRKRKDVAAALRGLGKRR